MNDKTLIKLAFPMMKGVKNWANFWGCDNIFVYLHKLILHIRCRQWWPDFRLCTFPLRLREREDLDDNMRTLPEYNYYGILTLFNQASRARQTQQMATHSVCVRFILNVLELPFALPIANNRYTCILKYMNQFWIYVYYLTCGRLFSFCLGIWVRRLLYQFKPFYY